MPNELKILLKMNSVRLHWNFFLSVGNSFFPFSLFFCSLISAEKLRLQETLFRMRSIRKEAQIRREQLLSQAKVLQARATKYKEKVSATTLMTLCSGNDFRCCGSGGHFFVLAISGSGGFFFSRVTIILLKVFGARHLRPALRKRRSAY